MFLIPLVALIIGVLLGIGTYFPIEGKVGLYLAMGVIAGLDSVIGGWRSALEGKFQNDVFVTGFRSGVADKLGLAYVHVVDMYLPDLDTLAMIRANWSGPVIANNMLKADGAAELIAAGRADAVSFGRPFIANPDLPHRIRAGTSLAKPDYDRLYTGEERGYIDYPALAEPMEPHPERRSS